MYIKHFWKPILWLAFICYGLLIPVDNIPKQPFFAIPNFDKIIHACMFFGFCLLLFRPYKKIHLKYYILAPITAVFFGIFLEATQQMLSQTRSCDIYDFIANLTGIILSIFFFRFFVSGKKWEILF